MKKIAAIISNQALANDVAKSIRVGISNPCVHLPVGKGVWDVFCYSLTAAIRDIQSHPRGKLFQRLIHYGPPHPDDPKTLLSSGSGVLSDPECGSCVDFIFSHMVNRFKGELAELLAIDPCVQLMQRLMKQRRLPTGIQLYWGDTIKEARRIGASHRHANRRWGSFTKGADAFLVHQPSNRKGGAQSKLRIWGVVETKSMRPPLPRLQEQIQRHLKRLEGGVQLDSRMWPASSIYVKIPLSIVVLPSSWRVDRACHWVERAKTKSMVYDKPDMPPLPSRTNELVRDLWKITLAWSQEALEQAAYEMTFWYMSQVGQHVYGEDQLPTEWQEMRPDEAGRNAIKMMLYYIMLRYISKDQRRSATKLYNIYSFGYPLGVDAGDMLWPENIVSTSGET